MHQVVPTSHVDHKGVLNVRNEELSGLRGKVVSLKEQVHLLERKLEVFHRSDINAIRRAHKSLAQHTQALVEERKHVEPLLRALAEEVFTPEFIAEELTFASLAGASALSLASLLKAFSRKGSWTPVTVLVGAFSFIGLRLTCKCAGRVAQVAKRYQKNRARLLKEWVAISDRIDIMTALSEWDPDKLPAANAASSSWNPWEGDINKRSSQVLF